MKLKRESLVEVKRLLSRYSEENIMFNEPHFTERLLLREGNREEVIHLLLNPDNLVYVESRTETRGISYTLYFDISNTRTVIIPLVFRTKSLYIITYIQEYKPWIRLLKKKRRI